MILYVTTQVYPFNYSLIIMTVCLDYLFICNNTCLFWLAESRHVFLSQRNVFTIIIIMLNMCMCSLMLVFCFYNLNYHGLSYWHWNVLFVFYFCAAKCNHVCIIACKGSIKNYYYYYYYWLVFTPDMSLDKHQGEME